VTEFRKRELLLFYGLGYLVIAILETILFTAIIGEWNFSKIFLNFSIWGIIWLVSMFAYPMFFLDANRSNLALNPYFVLAGYVIIILGYYFTYRFHLSYAEKRAAKKLNFSRLLNLYFPIKKSEKVEKPAK